MQERLKEQNPDRDLPEYDGRKWDVESIKLDFLRSLTPLVDDDDDPEASNEDDFDINSFFPVTLSFLHLSALGPKAKGQNRLPLPLFLRREYHHISAMIEDEEGPVIVSGQPGTGGFLVSLCLTGSNQLVDIKARRRISTSGSFSP
jgi:hypothetical protein